MGTSSHTFRKDVSLGELAETRAPKKCFASAGDWFEGFRWIYVQMTRAAWDQTKVDYETIQGFHDDLDYLEQSRAAALT